MNKKVLVIVLGVSGIFSSLAAFSEETYTRVLIQGTSTDMLKTAVATTFDPKTATVECSDIDCHFSATSSSGDVRELTTSLSEGTEITALVKATRKAGNSLLLKNGKVSNSGSKFELMSDRMNRLQAQIDACGCGAKEAKKTSH